MEQETIKKRVIGIDISLEATSYAIVDVKGEVVVMDSFPTLDYPDINLFVSVLSERVMEMLRYEGISPAGKHCVVIGRSNIVGKPMAMLLLHENGTVTITHSRTKDLAAFTQNADILVAAVGKAKFVTADMVKEGAVIVDVGMNRDENGKLCGDVDFDSVKEKCSYITPVPGGVGPMTIAMLMQNTLKAFEIQQG